MAKSARSKAEEQFIAAQKKDKQILNDKDKAWQKTTTQVQNLRALRLAKEAAETEAAEAEAAAAKEAAATASPKKRAAKKK